MLKKVIMGAKLNKNELMKQCNNLQYHNTGHRIYENNIFYLIKFCSYISKFS